jgi:hypothetical protein
MMNLSLNSRTLKPKQLRPRLKILPVVQVQLTIPHSKLVILLLKILTGFLDLPKVFPRFLDLSKISTRFLDLLKILNFSKKILPRLKVYMYLKIFLRLDVELKILPSW